MLTIAEAGEVGTRVRGREGLPSWAAAAGIAVAAHRLCSEQQHHGQVP